MSNWRDRTERDATLSHRRDSPDSSQFNKISDSKLTGKSWHFYWASVILPTIASVLLLSFSSSLLTSLFVHLNVATIEKPGVVVTCEKDNKGGSILNITDVDGSNKRPFIEWNSEAICKEVSIELNKQINADRKSKLDDIDKSKLKEPRTSSTYQKSKQSGGSR
jgi:hypothetical protein